jgi:spatacsin
MNNDKSLDLLQALELFTRKSLITPLVAFFRAIEVFAFGRAEKMVPELLKMLKNDEIWDEFLGPISLPYVLHGFVYKMEAMLLDKLAKRSPIHVYKFLELLDLRLAAPNLGARVKLCQVIKQSERPRRAVVHIDLLGDPAAIVFNLILHHSLGLGQDAAHIFGISAHPAVQQWINHKYSSAVTPKEVLEVHQEVVGDLAREEDNGKFFVILFASLLPYAQPTDLLPLIGYAANCLDGDNFQALTLFLEVCKKHKIEAIPSVGSPPTLQNLLELLFGSFKIPESVKVPKIVTPVLFSLRSLQQYFNDSVDDVINICLNEQNGSGAKLICKWRNRDKTAVRLLETIQKVVSNEVLSLEQQRLVLEFGKQLSTEALLDAIAAAHGSRFVRFANHYKASIALQLSVDKLLIRKTSEFLKSSLSTTPSRWQLVRDLIQDSQLSPTEIAFCLANSFWRLLGSRPGKDRLPIDDYDKQFTEFANLGGQPRLLGDQLLLLFEQKNTELAMQQQVGSVLHASLCCSDTERCAEILNGMVRQLVQKRAADLITQIVLIFPNPALLPKYIEYQIREMSPSFGELSEKVAKVVMSCARRVKPFEPEHFFELTLRFNLFREHAQLQVEAGVNAAAKGDFRAARQHYLLGLAYFLHEKCFSLAMDCLRKLALLSLPVAPTFPILKLTKEAVIQLVRTADFDFAMTLAIGYDMDDDVSWGESLYYQVVLNQRNEFLECFIRFRSLTRRLATTTADKYKAEGINERRKKRMKRFVNYVPNLIDRYEIAKDLLFNDVIDKMKSDLPLLCEWCGGEFKNR